ncbi:MAG: serpin family protein [Firmicutes bacterium]|nr:serpin family protein [Bacillota bacterium]
MKTKRLFLSLALAAVLMLCVVFASACTSVPAGGQNQNGQEQTQEGQPDGKTPDDKQPDDKTPDDKSPVGAFMAKNLMEGVVASEVTGSALDEAFKAAVANFSVELFKESFSVKENSLISPTSVLLALAMAANGADGATLSQMEAMLGGGLNIAELNAYLYSYIGALPSEEKSKLEIANSVWIKDGAIDVKPAFLQTNANYYGAAAYRAAFDESTVADINAWCSENTDGLIDSILDKIPPEAVLYLINAVLFDAEWQKIYNEKKIFDGVFNAANGKKQTVPFMLSEENRYLEGDGAVGFIKPYAGNRYSFAAVLPDEGVKVEDYVASLSGEKFRQLLQGVQNTQVYAEMPKFEYGYEIGLNGALQSLGMNDAFIPGLADFTSLGSAGGDLYISSVKHKTFITVDERGTKAGAVTSVEFGVTSGGPSNYKYVTLDRPFVYAIIDNATLLPVFLGAVLEI